MKMLPSRGHIPYRRGQTAHLDNTYPTPDVNNAVQREVKKLTSLA